MQNIPLKELNWFSFDTEWYNSNYLSIFQAIVYILENEADLNDDNTLRRHVDEYVESITKHEADYADVMYVNYEQPTEESHIEHSDTGQDILVTVLQDVENTEVYIPANKIKDELSMLNDFRIELTGYMGSPISTVYDLLRAEVNNHTAGKGTTLKLKTITTEEYTTYYFKKSGLKKWKSLNILKKLGLLDTNLKPLNKIRQDRLDNVHMTIGVLLHMLMNSILSDSGEPVNFTFDSGDKNTNEFSLYQYITDHVIDDFSSNFPKKSAFLAIMKEVDEACKFHITYKKAEEKDFFDTHNLLKNK